MGSLRIEAAPSGRDLNARIAARLDTLIPCEETSPSGLHRAMRHTAMAPSKRVRPMLTLIVTEHLGGDPETALDPGCAIEMIHAASLIFDDLPAMDDASERRGRPSNHIAFDEATAMLAGIGLLSRAFGVVSTAPDLDPAQRAAIGALLAESVGSEEGTVGGQFHDLRLQAGGRDQAALNAAHAGKTAALFVACARVAGVVVNAAPSRMEKLSRFGASVGAAFQAFDDLRDASQTNCNRDAATPANLVVLIGEKAARARAWESMEHALATIADIGCKDSPLDEYVKTLATKLERG